MPKLRRQLLAAVLFAVPVEAMAQAGRTAPATPPAPAGIDLNSASQNELMTLEGIGEVRANAIIRARPFKAKTELVERHIIPEALYDKINGKVIVRAAPAPAATPAPTPAPPRR
jgi:DNA uptake protein ComE-like DNA-binding protein